MVVSVDDGDGWRRNESLVSLRQSDAVGGGQEPLTPIDLGDGVSVGGLPELVGVTVVSVLDDLKNSCLDDVRVSGRQLPLPPALNGSRWSQVTSWQGLEPGCSAPDACLNTTCDAPLSCVSTWGSASCRCGRGQQVVGGVCEDLDECVWQPCLHGGSCYNLRPGFQCVCGPGHAGDHCQWTHPATPGHPLTATVAIAALTLSLLLLVVMGVVISVRLRRQWLVRGIVGHREVQEATVLEVMETGRKNHQGDAPHKAFLERLQIRLPQTRSTPLGKEERVPASESSEYTAGVPIRTGAPVPKVVDVPTVVGVPAGVGTVAGSGVVSPDPLPAKDDLRAYAYEGDGSSAGSLSSALSGLREEQPEEGSIKPIVPEFLEVMDLLKNLPEASMSPLLTKRENQVSRKTEQHTSKSRGQALTSLPTKGAIYSMTKTRGSSPVLTKTTTTVSPRRSSVSVGDEEQKTVC
ncbi:hypothetical protein OTU49_001805 [Cherax quadricarinatus]|uniref:EGF-like domain-containing protein n=2 Tax=Cherax quadricarinatus TaxID=27406 RepID=A0AAW0XRP4_CHEQU